MSKRKSATHRTKRPAKSRRRLRTAKPRQQIAPLSTADWVERASDLLVENNVNGVGIVKLCEYVGVSKGSFYWHFEDRSDLLAAILKDWRMRMTLNVNARVFLAGVSARTVLHRLLGLIRKPRSDREGSIERSVRDWARIDRRARDAVVEVDQMRLRSIEVLMRQCGFEGNDARTRAYAAYAIMMGDSILKETVDFPDLPEEYIDTFIELLLSSERPRGSYDTNAAAERESA